MMVFHILICKEPNDKIFDIVWATSIADNLIFDKELKQITIKNVSQIRA